MLWRFLLNSKYRFFSVHSTAEIYGVGLHPATRLATSSIHCVYRIPGARLVCRDFIRPSPFACGGWGLARETTSQLPYCCITGKQPAPSAPSVFPAKNRRSEIAVTLKAKLKWTIFREFPGYLWLFWTQHLSRCGARLVEEERRKKERRKKKMNNSEFRSFQVRHFKIVTTHCYYYYRLGQAL